MPAEANMGLSCGNPTATAHLRPGEVVVDLGSGAGLDVFLAAKMVGPEGRAIGIDMTTAMIERARANATVAAIVTSSSINPPSIVSRSPMPRSIALSQTAFSISHPISPAVFREIARVLKPGGRLAVSDIALKQELSGALARNMAAYVGCIATVPTGVQRNYRSQVQGVTDYAQILRSPMRLRTPAPSSQS